MRPTIGVIIPEPLRSRLFSAEDRAALGQLGEVRWIAPGEDPVATLAGCEIGLGSWGTAHPATPGLLAACPRLRLWVHVAGSVKHMFGPHLEGRDLTIATCKGAIADAVAEYTLGALIVGLRQATENAWANRAAPVGASPTLRLLACSTVAVIGASEVGRRVMRLLGVMGARVRCYDPHVADAVLDELGAQRAHSVVAACGGSDAVTIHTPLLPSTRGLVDARALAALPDGALVVNTARGECLDQAALEAELERGRLHAWLDVTSPEPVPADHPLRRLPQVVLTSHLAGPAAETLGRRAVSDVAAFLRGGQPQCVVTSDMLGIVA